MRIVIRHEIKGRIRFSTGKQKLSFQEADMLLYYLESLDGVTSAKVYEQTGNAVVCFRKDRNEILKKIQKFSFQDKRMIELVPEQTGRELMSTYREKLIMRVTGHYFCKFFCQNRFKLPKLLFRRFIF